MTMRMYGIPNCDSVRKARQWLEQRGLPYDFVDLKTDVPSRGQLEDWLARVGGERLINRRSTTWKGLSEAEKLAAIEGDPVAVLQAHPTLIKRPVLEHESEIMVGFSEHDYQASLT